MFQFTEANTFQKLNESIGYFEAEYRIVYDTGEIKKIKLNVEQCKPGLNLNTGFYEYIIEKIEEDTIEDIHYDKNVEDFYCIQSDKSDINLFYQPNIGYSDIKLNIIIKNQNLYEPEDICLMIIYENNFLNHDNKNTPISRGVDYKFIQGFNAKEINSNSVHFNYQYIKYETDNSLLLNDFKYFKSLSFLDLTYLKKNREDNFFQNLNQNNETNIGSIMFSIYKSNYDYYRRTYKKIQTLLAEIMSIVRLLFNIGKIITSFINKKKMSIDVISKLFYVENQNRLMKNYRNNDRVKLAPEKMNYSFKITEKNNIFMKTSENLDDENESQKEKVLKRINILNIIISLCCKGNKEKLITLCRNIIINDMCIETIIERFYNLLNIYYSIRDLEKYNLGLNKMQNFKEINSIIYNINNKIASGTK